MARRVAVAALAAYALLVALGAATQGPAWFVRFGEGSVMAARGTEVLGEEVPTPFVESHDGTAFWALARDPLLREPEVTTEGLDRPAYRAQRIAYPLLAAPWRLAGEHALLWGLLVTNVAAVGVGTYLSARLGQRLGVAPAAAGAAFAANPVVLVGVMLDLAEVVALAGAVAVVLGVRQRRWAVATVGAVVAVLAKEPMIAVVAAVALGATAAAVRDRVRLVVVPAVVALAWGGYQRSRLGWPPSQLEEVGPVPLGGFADAFTEVWRPEGRWADAVVAVVLLALVAWATWRWWRRRTLELWACLPSLLLVVATPQVVHLSINSARSVGPLLTFLALDRLAERSSDAAPARVDAAT